MNMIHECPTTSSFSINIYHVEHVCNEGLHINWTSIVHIDDKYIMTSADRIAYSISNPDDPNSINEWKIVSVKGSGYVWSPVIKVYWRYIMVSCNRIAYSEDLENWKTIGVNISDGWSSIIHANGKYVMSGHAQIAYSEDLKNWKTVNIANCRQRVSQIIYIDGKYIASSGGSVIYSEDLDNWAIIRVKSHDAITSISHVNGIYVITGFDQINYSTNLTNWTAVMVDDCYWSSIVYIDGIYVMCAYSRNQIAYSKDLNVWNYSDSIGNDNWSSMIYINDTLMLPGHDRIIYYKIRNNIVTISTDRHEKVIANLISENEALKLEIKALRLEIEALKH